MAIKPLLVIMIDLFISNPVLLIFFVMALGYWFGSIHIKGMNLGVAAVLFTGLFIGAFSNNLNIPETFIQFGLAVFIYTIGLSNGPSFFQIFKQRGTKDLLFVVIMLSISALITIGLFFLFGFDSATAAGILAGTTTNTPALAGLLDSIEKGGFSAEEISNLSNQAVIGYSLSYPMGVLGVMIAIKLASKWLKVNYVDEEEILSKEFPIRSEIISKTIIIENPDIVNTSIRDLKRLHSLKIVFGRAKKKEETLLTYWDTRFELGDVVIAIGKKSEIEKTIELLGKEIPKDEGFTDGIYDSRRIFVSNSAIVGQSLASLDLPSRFSALVTRVRRGDIDLLATSTTVLELGDQIRFIAKKEEIPKLSKFFGNSYESLSQINLLSFGMGMAIGLLIGMGTFQLSDSFEFQLGYAGGPLVAGLVLGSLRRTGPIVWSLPYGANLTLRQLGLTLMLAGIGINSGHTFWETIKAGEGGYIFLSGTIIAIVSTLITLFVGYKLFKTPYSILIGMISNQPAILDFSIKETGNKLPNIGYTLILPAALILKILFVQLLFTIL